MKAIKVNYGLNVQWLLMFLNVVSSGREMERTVCFDERQPPISQSKKSRVAPKHTAWKF